MWPEQRECLLFLWERFRLVNGFGKKQFLLHNFSDRSTFPSTWKGNFFCLLFFFRLFACIACGCCCLCWKRKLNQQVAFAKHITSEVEQQKTVSERAAETIGAVRVETVSSTSQSEEIPLATVSEEHEDEFAFSKTPLKKDPRLRNRFSPLRPSSLRGTRAASCPPLMNTTCS